MTKKLPSTLLALAVAVAGALAPPAQAEPDAKGCKDHPLFTRMKGYRLTGCEQKFDQLVVRVNEDPDHARNPRPEGQLTRLSYEFDSEATAPSFLQVKRNYQNAARQQGAAVLAEFDRYTALQFKREAGNVYAGVEVFNEGRKIELAVLEEQAMQQEVTANLMWKAMQKDGYVTLYINFDTNKAVIKPESAGTVKQIAALLKEQPALKVAIEGHTDNQGTPDGNRTLSLNRAKAVMAAVVADGIKADRVSAVGRGQDVPIADNRSEEGRAKNRRVEIVKK